MSQSANGPIALQELLTNLRAECGHSTNVAFGQNERQSLVYLLNRTQLDLWENYDWPFLFSHRQVQVQAGVALYTFPPVFRFEDITRLAWFDGANSLVTLQYGVGPAEYALFNSLARPPVTSSPPRRWRIADGTLPNTLEIWPTPDASAAHGMLYFEGTIQPTPMVADSDLCTLPWRIIVLSAAAEVLAAEKDPSAGPKAQRAAELIRRFKVRQSTHKGGVIPLGGHAAGRAPRVGLDFIPNGYGSGPRRS